MEILFEETGSKGAFYMEKDGVRLAEMIFSKGGEGLIIIEHTEVGEALKGTGAGKKLVFAAVDYARKHQIKIVPLCPFANSVFVRSPDLADVWKK